MFLIENWKNSIIAQEKLSEQADEHKKQIERNSSYRKPQYAGDQDLGLVFGLIAAFMIFMVCVAMYDLSVAKQDRISARKAEREWIDPIYWTD